jgi:hypothetical protein
VPTLLLAQDKRDNPVAAVLIPLQLTAERAGDELSDTQREAIDEDESPWPAILIPPRRGSEGRQMLVRLQPVPVKRRGLVSDEPEGANA